MRFVKEKNFGEVKAFELGYSPVGKPLMAVHIYFVDGLCIDTGQSNMARKVMQIVRSNRPGAILLTHHHEDHSGNAAAISSSLNIPVFGHPVTVKKMKSGFDILPFQHIIWGKAEPVSMAPLPKTIETQKFKLEPIHTPGHSKDHTVFWEKNRGWLFSGDIYLSDRVKYFRSDENIKDQLDSLRKIMSYDFDALFCCHHPEPGQGKSKLSQNLDFLDDFYGRVKILYEKGNRNEKIIFREMGLKEEKLVKWFCMGNVCMFNMVRSSIASLRKQNETTLDKQCQLASSFHYFILFMFNKLKILILCIFLVYIFPHASLAENRSLFTLGAGYVGIFDAEKNFLEASNIVFLIVFISWNRGFALEQRTENSMFQGEG